MAPHCCLHLIEGDRSALAHLDPSSDAEGMTTDLRPRQERSRRAGAALAALPHGGHAAIRLRVHCAVNHHVAKIYETDSGLVYESTIRRHSHGDRDLPDKPHGDHEPTRWLDFLTVSDDPTTDDVLPAWCDCGPRSLSRQAIRSWVASGEQRVVID